MAAWPRRGRGGMALAETNGRAPQTGRMAFGTELGCVYHARICLSQFFALQVYTYNLQGYNYSNLS